MSDYLGHLATRILNRAEVLQPRLTSLFEPASASMNLPISLPDSISNTEIGAVETLSAPSPPSSLPADSIPPSPLPPLALPAHSSLSPPTATSTRQSNVNLSVLPLSLQSSSRNPGDTGTIHRLPNPPKLEPVVQPELIKHLSLQSSSRNPGDTGTIHRLPNPPKLEPVVQPELIKHNPSAIQSNLTATSVPEQRSHQEARPITANPGIQPPIVPLPEQISASPSAPATIQVRIGRIEVRAVTPPRPTPKSAKPPPPKLSLAEYLRSRNGGKP